MSSVVASLAGSESPATACFSIRARAEPGVLPRVIELFAKRGLVPSALRGAVSRGDPTALELDIQMCGLGREAMDYIAACMRQIASVEAVLTTAKSDATD